MKVGMHKTFLVKACLCIYMHTCVQSICPRNIKYHRLHRNQQLNFTMQKNKIKQNKQNRLIALYLLPLPIFQVKM